MGFRSCEIFCSSCGFVCSGIANFIFCWVFGSCFEYRVVIGSYWFGSCLSCLCNCCGSCLCFGFGSCLCLCCGSCLCFGCGSCLCFGCRVGCKWAWIDIGFGKGYGLGCLYSCCCDGIGNCLCSFGLIVRIGMYL